MVYIEHGLVKRDIGVPRNKRIECLPVGDGPAPGEQAGIGNGNRTTAQTQDGHPTPMCPLEHLPQRIAGDAPVAEP